MSVERPRIAVFGSTTVIPGDRACLLAHDLGRALALAGGEVMTGGYHGAMEACSRGVHEAGGHGVGVIVDRLEGRDPVNVARTPAHAVRAALATATPIACPSVIPGAGIDAGGAR